MARRSKLAHIPRLSVRAQGQAATLRRILDQSSGVVAVQRGDRSFQVSRELAGPGFQLLEKTPWWGVAVVFVEDGGRWTPIRMREGANQPGGMRGCMPAVLTEEGRVEVRDPIVFGLLMEVAERWLADLAEIGVIADFAAQVNGV